MMSNRSQQIDNPSEDRRTPPEEVRFHQHPPTSDAQAIPRRAVTEGCSLSYAQQRFWFLDQFSPGSAAGNVSTALHLAGPLDTLVLEQSLTEVVRRHEILRTTFVILDGRPVPVVAPDHQLTLHLVNLQELPAIQRRMEAMRLAREEIWRPFDLSRGPLLRVVLLRLAEEEHILLLTLHQIVSDEASLTVFLREVAALYEAFLADRPSSLPPLPLQYADFAHWQRQRLQAGVLAAQLSYWKHQLEGPLPVLELPADRPRPAVPSFRGDTQRLELSPSLTEALQALSRREGATLYMTLLAAFQALLARYTSQEDTLVGTCVANRDRMETEILIGCLANTLVLRTDLTGDPSFRELLARVREVSLQANAHQDPPFEVLLEELHPERDHSHTPLFQAMFLLRDAHQPSLEMPGLTVRRQEFDTGKAAYDLTLSVVVRSEGLHAEMNYNTDLFDGPTITRMLGHFQTLLEGIVANPEQRLSQLPLLTEAERHQLLVEWNNTARDYPVDQCLHHLFEAQVERTPDAVALVFGNERLTYAELNRRANQLAHYLQSLGVGAEVLVGICAERSLELVVGLLGILKAGGAYVPLDPEYPKERLAFMMRDAQVQVLLTQEQFLKELPERGPHVICLDKDWEAIAQECEDKPNTSAAPENLAYVIYTSGSTGQPKGAMNTHRGICNRLLWMQDTYRLTAADRVLQKTPFSFDVSVWEFFWPLLAGACLVVARPGGHRDSAYLGKLIDEQAVTTLHFVPSMLRVFLGEIAPGSCRSLRRVICSGEALSFELQQRFFACLDAELHNLYGPTEAAVDVTFWACERDSPEPFVPIGRPIANTQIYLLDRHLQPVPVGLPGELHIGGVGVGRGYLNRPELTSERFILDSFSTDPEARLYKTGDLARYRPEGNIEFLGRIDHQVKIRGFRIELGEIEAALSQSPAVRECVLVAREDRQGEKRLIAYVVLDPHQATTISDLRSFLEERLPQYMLPSAFVPLEALPLSPNGKLDRNALPEVETTRPDLAQAYVAPRTALESFLASIWCDILNLDRVGLHDKFFEVGGDSILGARFVNRVQQELGEFIYIVTLFEAPTIAQYARYLEREYAAAVVTRFKSDPPAILRPLPTRTDSVEATAIDAAQIVRMRRAIPTLSPSHPSKDDHRPKNPQAIFILAPPRSGTTLLRVMLAGSPNLFAAAELQLLGFNTLKERRSAFSGKHALWLEGTIRALMEIKRCNPEEAKWVMEECERQDLTTRQFYGLLQEWVAPRVLVDKSPSYVLDLPTLQRAESDFQNALYIHLVRHPYAMTRSFVSYHMDQVLFLYDHPFSPPELGELVWLISHQNTLEFLRSIPSHRQFRARFEDLVSRPGEVMQELCRTLSLDFHPDMVQPYKDKEKKMTDGLYPESTPMGDTRFHEHGRINPKVVEKWGEVRTDCLLGTSTWEVAVLLGYQRPTESGSGSESDLGCSAKQPLSSRARLLQRQHQLRRQHRTSSGTAR